MKRTIAIAYFLIVFAACATVFFVKAAQPTSAGAYLFFTAWLVTPYIFTCAALFFLRRKSHAFYPLSIAAIIVSAGGVLLLADFIYWHPDAQGAIAMLMIPIFQGGALVALLPTIFWMSRKFGTQQRVQP